MIIIAMAIMVSNHRNSNQSNGNHVIKEIAIITVVNMIGKHRNGNYNNSNREMTDIRMAILTLNIIPM